MTKRYSSSARVVIGVVLDDGSNMRIAFHPMTGGGSYFVTSSERLQKAIEGHSGYGKTFIGNDVAEEQKPAAVAEEPKGPKQIKVSSIEDAKDYLADRFGLSRTKLRSKAAITEAAAANNIEFIFAEA